MYFYFAVHSGKPCKDSTASVPRNVPHHRERHRDVSSGHEMCVQSPTHHTQKIRSQGMV